MRKLLFASVLIVASSSILWGQAAQQAQPPAPQAAPAPALPDARTIVDRHIEAVGGRAAILAHSSTKTTGTYAVPSQGINGTFEAFAAKPNKMLLKIALPGIGDISEGFDGTHAWSISPMTGPTLTQGKELEQKQFDADFYAELYDQARYESIKTVEKTTFDGRPCYKVSFVRKGGEEDFGFYDVATGLRAGGIVTRETPMGRITATETRGEYKKFGDLLQPVTFKQSLMGIDQVLTFNTVEYDKVDPAVFELPAPIKALIK